MKAAIQILDSRQPSFSRAFARVRAVAEAQSEQVDAVARDIIRRVRKDGDHALLELTEKFDGVRLSTRTLRVPEADLDAALASLPRKVVAALRLAAKRIRVFHERQRQASWQYRDELGMVMGQKITPLRRVGLYVPGGHASYPSSVLMNAIPARVAGVDEIVIVSPAGRDGYNPAVLAAARIAGVSTVYRIGGAQAVAALAYGTKTIPRVDKIVGPGNAWVQAAKKLCYGQVDIDSIAGPSEVLILADDSGDPALIAADLLAQAEHGSGDESVVLVTWSRRTAERVAKAIADQLPTLPRREAIARILAKRSALIVTRNQDEAVDIAEQVAPEHLEIFVRRPKALVARLRNAGAIFVGPHASAPLGDYIAGPNHVLPTGGSARFFSPLGVYDFVKRTSVVTGSARGVRALGHAVITLAELEGYHAHAQALRLRL